MPARAQRASRRGFGKLRRLPSRGWQATRVGPDLERHAAPHTFDSTMDGEAWRAAAHRLADADDWLPPAQRQRRRGLTFEAHTDRWLEVRVVTPSTRQLYRGILDRSLVPAFGDRLITRITHPAQGLQAAKAARAEIADGEATIPREHVKVDLGLA